MGRRLGLALGLSVLAHLALVAIGLGLGYRRVGGPVDVEITGMRLDEIKDLPLGAPVGNKGATHAPRRVHHHAPPAPAAGTLAAPAAEKETPGASAGATDDGTPAPTNDLGAYGPRGSRLTVLLRLDRLRGTDYAAPLDALLGRLPDRRDLLDGTGLDLFTAFDALLIATPHPLDPTVTFLAVRHHLDDGALKAALTEGAHATGRQITWTTDRGHAVAARRPQRGMPAGPLAARDDRLIVLAAPGLAIVTPPAYRALLLSHGAAPGAAPDGGAPALSTAEIGDDAGVASADGGLSPVLEWATLLSRIDAEEGLMPPDGVFMVSASDIFKTNGAGGLPPVLYGLDVPVAFRGTATIADQPALEVEGEFPSEEPARRWETEWPALRRKLETNPFLLLSGFSSLVGRAELTRDGKVVHLQVTATHDETLRLLQFALHLLGGR